MHAKFATEGTYSPDALIAGNSHLLVAEQVTISAGQVLPRGAVLGKVTSAGEYVLSASGASDGSEAPDRILAQDVDASAGDVRALTYIRGDFAASAVTLGTGHTLAAVTEALRGKGITLLRIVD